MISYTFHIKENKEFLRYQESYSHLLRRMYSNKDKWKDVVFKKSCLEQTGILDVMYWDSAIVDIEGKSEAQKTIKTDRDTELVRLNKEMEKLEESKDSDKYYSTKFFKLRKKINRLKDRIEKDAGITFGGKALLRTITYNSNMYHKTGKSFYLEAYEKKLDEYRNKRILPLFVVGKACEGGNRKYDFDFPNGEITFKADRHTKFNIKIKIGKNRIKEMLLLQQLIDQDKISVTVQLTTKTITITFDNEYVNGYGFEKTLYKREVKKCIDSVDAKQVQELFRKEQFNRQMKNKDESCFAGIDLNPERIGFVIIKNNKVVCNRSFELDSLLADNIGNNTNLIKYNLAKIYREIFKYCEHYKVSHFVTEELEFDNPLFKPTKSNRKTQNLWCRKFQLDLVCKHTQNNGIVHLQINPAFSSFVGNLMFGLYDPISAALEITRRGLVLTKKSRDSWYPAIQLLRLDNYRAYVPDLEKCRTIPTIYRKLRSLNLGYRRLDKPNLTSSLINCSVLQHPLNELIQFNIF